MPSTEKPDEETLRLLLDEEEEEERKRCYEPRENYPQIQDFVEELIEEEAVLAESEEEELERTLSPSYQEMKGMEGVRDISDIVAEYGESFLTQKKESDAVGPRTYLGNEVEPVYSNSGVEIDYDTQTRQQRGFDVQEEEEDKPRVDPFHENV